MPLHAIDLVSVLLLLFSRNTTNAATVLSRQLEHNQLLAERKCHRAHAIRRYGLAVGAASAPFVRALRLLVSPIAWPISRLLDLLLGKDKSALFKRSQLKALVEIHAQEEGGHLSDNEVRIMCVMIPKMHRR